MLKFFFRYATNTPQNIVRSLMVPPSFVLYVYTISLHVP